MLLTAREAADRLGIKLDTLYAYVSRGRLRSVAVPGTRQRRYRVEDIEALRGAAGGSLRTAEAEALTPGHRVVDLPDRERPTVLPRSGCDRAVRHREPGECRAAFMAGLAE